MKGSQLPHFMPALRIRTTIRNRAGIITSFREEDGHSWTRWAWNMMFTIMADIPGTGIVDGQHEGAGILTARNTVKTLLSASVTANNRGSNTLAGRGFHNTATSDAHGIVVGAGASPFCAEKNHVDAFITHGSGAGQLAYGAMDAPVITHDSETRKWTARYSRVFNNNSGETITARSVGMVTRYGLFSSDSYVLMTYDVFEEEKVIENGGQLAVDVDLISPEFSIDANQPVPGEQRYGGTIAGIFDGRVIVVSPKTGGYMATAANFLSPAETAPTSDHYDGTPNTAILMGKATSGIGQWCKAVNEGSPLLGGYDDWYIPSRHELQYMLQSGIVGLLAGSPDETMELVSYWSSTATTGSNGYYAGVVGASWGEANTSQTGNHRLRLIRSFPVNEYEPAE